MRLFSVLPIKFYCVERQKILLFFISHRLSACKICDRILVFDQQGIVQQGTHDALLENADGLYYKMWHAQTKNYMV